MLYDTFIAPLTPTYMQRALLEVLLIAFPAGLLGAWVVVRRLAFLTHAVGHATFPALVIAALAGWSALGATVAAALVIAAAMALLVRLLPDAAGVGVAVVLSTSLAIGAVLVSDISDPGVSANGLLFGSIFGLTSADVLASLAVALVCLLVTVTTYRPAGAAAFDRDLARSLRGGAAGRIEVVQLALLAVAVGVSARVIGSLLVSALFLIPAATARQFTVRLPSLMAWATILAACDGVAGLWLAAQLDTPPGASIAACAAAAFVVVSGLRALVGLRARRLAT